MAKSNVLSYLLDLSQLLASWSPSPPWNAFLFVFWDSDIAWFFSSVATPSQSHPLTILSPHFLSIWGPHLSFFSLPWFSHSLMILKTRKMTFLPWIHISTDYSTSLECLIVIDPHLKYPILTPDISPPPPPALRLPLQLSSTSLGMTTPAFLA